MINEFCKAVEKHIEERIERMKESNAGLSDDLDVYRGNAHRIKAYKELRDALPDILHRFIQDDEDDQ
jgi:hypothetical protein